MKNTFQFLLALALALVFGLYEVVAETSPKPSPKTEKVKLTKHEQKIVQRAGKIFKDGKKDPPPSIHMIDKMQSGVGR